MSQGAKNRLLHTTLMQCGAEQGPGARTAKTPKNRQKQPKTAVFHEKPEFCMKTHETQPFSDPRGTFATKTTSSGRVSQKKSRKKVGFRSISTFSKKC